MGSDDIETVKSLLEKYLDGNTSLDEERLLMEYFSAGNVDAELEYAAAMFGFFEKGAAEIYVLKEDSLKVSDSALRNAADESKSCLKNNNKRRWFYGAASVAAAIALVAGGYFAVSSGTHPQVYCYINGDAVTDIDVAVRQAELADRIINIGIQTTRQGVDAVEVAQKSANSFDAALSALDKIGRIVSRVE